MRKATRTTKLLRAVRALERVKSQAKAKLVQADADRQTKLSVYEQENTKKKEIEAEIAKCLIYSPQDGLVVYYVPDQVRGGGGSQQSIVAQGEPVREAQKLMQIPDLKQMLVKTKVVTLLALMSWLLPLTAIFSPASLTGQCVYYAC